MALNPSGSSSLEQLALKGLKVYCSKITLKQVLFVHCIALCTYVTYQLTVVECDVVC